MYQLLVAGSEAYTTQNEIDKVAAGAVGVFVNENGQLKVTADGANVKDDAMLVLGRTAEMGGPIVLPISKNKFSFVKGVYQAPTKFKADVTIPAGAKIGDYTIILVKKGVKFNERNRWSAVFNNKETSTSAVAMAKPLQKELAASYETHGVNVTLSGAKITFEAQKVGDDYEIVMADNLIGVQVNYATRGSYGYGTKQHVKELAEKAAADKGYNYTYEEDHNLLNPLYGQVPDYSTASVDTGFTIFTLKFANPRATRTVDTVINQLVHVAFPIGSEAITTFETVLKAIEK